MIPNNRWPSDSIVIAPFISEKSTIDDEVQEKAQAAGKSTGRRQWPLSGENLGYGTHWGKDPFAKIRDRKRQWSGSPIDVQDLFVKSRSRA